MSQPSGPPVGATSVATAAPAPPAVAPATTGMQTGPRGVVASTPAAKPRRDTPHQLRLLNIGVILVGLIFAVVGALTFSYLAYSLHRAEADTAQLIRVQQIQTNLLKADATATNAFLVGGLEPPAQRAAYDDAIAATGTLIAQAAEAQPADADALAALNEQVVDLRRDHRAGPGEQPAGIPGRRPVPPQCQRRPPRRRAADPRQPRRRERRAGWRRDGCLDRLGLPRRRGAGTRWSRRDPGLAGPPVPAHDQQPAWRSPPR